MSRSSKCIQQRKLYNGVWLIALEIWKKTRSDFLSNIFTRLFYLQGIHSIGKRLLGMLCAQLSKQQPYISRGNWWP